MFAVLGFASLAIAGLTGSIVAVVRDGYRPVPRRSPCDRIRLP